MPRKPDPLELAAREMCLAAGSDPDARIPKPGSQRGMPAWCDFRDAARAAQNAREQTELSAQLVNLRTQDVQ